MSRFHTGPAEGAAASGVPAAGLEPGDTTEAAGPTTATALCAAIRCPVWRETPSGDQVTPRQAGLQNIPSGANPQFPLGPHSEAGSVWGSTLWRASRGFSAEGGGHWVPRSLGQTPLPLSHPHQAAEIARSRTRCLCQEHFMFELNSISNRT